MRLHSYFDYKSLWQQTVVSLSERNCNLCLFVLKTTDCAHGFKGYKFGFCIAVLWLCFRGSSDRKVLSAEHFVFVVHRSHCFLRRCNYFRLVALGVVKLVRFLFIVFVWKLVSLVFFLEQNKNVPL